MPVFITCSGCRQELQVPDHFHGKLVRCPSCKLDFTARLVPDEPAAAPRLAGPVEPVSRPSRYDPFQFDRPGRDIVRTPPREAPKSRAGAYVALVVLGFLILIGYVMVQHSSRKERGRDFLQFDVDVDLVQPPKPPADVLQEIAPLFDSLEKALHGGNRNEILSCFDIDRMFDELTAIDLMHGDEKSNAAFMRTFNKTVGQALEREAPQLAWDWFEYKQVKSRNENEAEVSIRCRRSSDGAILRTRWFVHRQMPGIWKIHDFEYLDTAVRLTQTPAVFEQLMVANWRVRNVLLDLADAQKPGKDPAAAERMLRDHDPFHLPSRLDAFRQLLLARLRLAQNRGEEALDSLQAAFARNVDMPCLELYKGMAHNQRSRWAQALNHLREYEGQFGDDSIVCEQLGMAQLGLRRLTDAAGSFRKALTFDAKNVSAFFGLISSLDPQDSRDDIGGLFEGLPDPETHFAKFAEDRRLAHDGRTLQELALAMIRSDFTHPSARYYLALARVWTGEVDSAVGAFKVAMNLEKDAGKRKDYVKHFMLAMTAINRPIAGYKAVPEAEAASAFRIVAAELKKNHRSGELRQLVAVHGKTAGNDPHYLFYQAEVFADEGDFARAARFFADGMMQPPDSAFLAPFRYKRVLACYHTGQMMTAYQDIGPRSETFLQLAHLCFDDLKFDELEKLLNAHVVAHASSIDLRRYRFRLRIKQNRFEEATALYKASIDGQSDGTRADLTYSFLRDMARAGKAVEAYQSMTDRQAFRVLAEQLATLRTGKDLKELVEAHRKAHPDDNLLRLHSARLLLEEKAWDRAAAEIAAFWNHLTRKDQADYRSQCAQVFCKAGKVLDGYRTLGTEAYPALAACLIADKNGADLLLLQAAHIPQHGDSAEVLFHRARAMAFLNRPTEAIAPFLQAVNQRSFEQRGQFVRPFVADMLAIDRGMEVYRMSGTDRPLTFSILAAEYTSRKNAESLSRLLTAHRRNHPDDALLPLYTAELHLLRGEPNRAELILAGAPVNAATEKLYRQAVKKVRVRAGMVVATFQETPCTLVDFEDLAQVCVQEKNDRQLEALIAAYRGIDAECPHLPAWEAEVHWLRGEYAGLLQHLKEHRDLFAWPRYREKAGHLQVRCLVKLKRSQEAVTAAENMLDVKRGRVLPLVLAHAAAGNVQEAIAVVEKNQHQLFLVEDCYRDPDLGPLLRSEAFREFADRFPPPK